MAQSSVSARWVQPLGPRRSLATVHSGAETERVAVSLHIHEAGGIRAGRCAHQQLVRGVDTCDDQTLTLAESTSCHTDLAAVHAQARAPISAQACNRRDPGVALANRTTRVLMQAADLPGGFQYSTAVQGRFFESP